MKTQKSRLQTLVENIKESREARQRMETCGFSEHYVCNLWFCKAEAGFCEYQMTMGYKSYCRVPLKGNRE